MPYDPMPANKALDGEIGAITLIDETPEPGLVISRGPEILDSGRAIDPAHLPSRIQITGGARAVTDYDGYSNLLYISPRLKSLIEKLEPGKHQFFPVTLVDKRGNKLADHWTWTVCNRIDSVDRQNTTLILWKGVYWRPAQYLSDDELPPGYDRSTEARTVFNVSQIGGAHFWRDKYLLPGGLYCSDEAAEQIQEAGLTGITMIKAETV